MARDPFDGGDGGGADTGIDGSIDVTVYDSGKGGWQPGGMGLTILAGVLAGALATFWVAYSSSKALSRSRRTRFQGRSTTST